MSLFIRNKAGEIVAEIIPNFCSDVLDCDPDTLIGLLTERYPIRMADDVIVPGVPQWVHGSHPNLNYRGKQLRRTKMWFQIGSTQHFVRVYSYTGFQYGVLAAQFDVRRVPLLHDATERYNAWIIRRNHQAQSVSEKKKQKKEQPKPPPPPPVANHGIVTRYENGQDNIGMHFDKPKSLHPHSLITIVKLGPGSRRFRLEDLEGTVLFDQVVQAGSAIVMTVDQNLKTRHGVPVSEDCHEESGSLVFRTIQREDSVVAAARRAAQTEQARLERTQQRARIEE